MEEHALQRTAHTSTWSMNVCLVAVEMPEEEASGEGCHAIGSGDAHPHAVGAPDLREDEQEGHEKDELAAHRHEDATLRHADALEEVARHNLEAHDGREQADDAHAPLGEFCQLGVGGEEHDGIFGEEDEDDEVDAHDDGGEDDGLLQHLVHAVGQLGAEVEAGDGLHALTDAQHDHDEEERDAVDDAVGRNRHVAAVTGQTLVDEDDHEAGAELHGEGRHADAEDALHDALPQSVDARMQMNHVTLVRQDRGHIDERHNLRQHRGDGRTLDAHAEAEDEERVEDSVDHHRRDRCRHRHMRMSRTAQRRVQTQVEMRHHIAQQDDEHVVVGILQRVLRCAEEEQQRVDEDESQHTHEDADDDVERHQIAQHPLRRPVVLLSQLDGDHCRTAHAHHGAERRAQVHDRERHRQTAQRERTHLGDVSDEDAVHHIVE